MPIALHSPSNSTLTSFASLPSATTNRSHRNHRQFQDGKRVAHSTASSRNKEKGSGRNHLYEVPQPQGTPQDQLKLNLSKYTRTSDRRMMIRTLKDCSLLRIIPMEDIDSFPTKEKQWADLEVEISKSHLRINEGPSLGKATSHESNRPNKELLEILKKLCDQLTTKGYASSPKRGISTTASTSNKATSSKECSQDIYRNLLLRLDRRTASADAYFCLSSLLGCMDLVLQPPKKALPLRTDMTLYQTPGEGTIHSTTTTRHPFGLFRKSDLTNHHKGGGSKRPWIRLIASVHERTNLTSGQSVRYCSVMVQQDK